MLLPIINGENEFSIASSILQQINTYLRIYDGVPYIISIVMVKFSAQMNLKEYYKQKTRTIRLLSLCHETCSLLKNMPPYIGNMLMYGGIL